MPPRAEAATLTVADVAERYGVTPATVIQWIRASELKAVNVSRSPRSKKPRYRITAAALEAFEAARTPTPPVPQMKRRKQSAADVIRFY